MRGVTHGRRSLFAFALSALIACTGAATPTVSPTPATSTTSEAPSGPFVVEARGPQPGDPNDLCPRKGCEFGFYSRIRIPAGWVDAIDLRPAWSVSHGEGVTVVVLDLAIADVPDLRGKIEDRITGVGVAPTANAAASDHGTAMASIIGASTDNGRGTAGVGWDATLVGVDMGEAYAHFETLEPEVAWDRRHLVPLFRQAAAVPGVDIISFSSIVNPSPAFEREIERIVGSGIVVVAGAGNEETPGFSEPRYPAAYDGVIGAGAVLVAADGTVGVWAGSNVGEHADVYAPANVPSLRVEGRVDLTGGTSSATAVTSGVIALLLAEYPDLSPAQVEELLVSSARPITPLIVQLDDSGGEVVSLRPIEGDPKVRLLDAGALFEQAAALEA